MSLSGRTVQFLYNKSNPYGMLKDVAALKQIFRSVGITNFTEVDPHEPPRTVDIQVHLEVPIYANIPWAETNIFLVNPEYYDAAAYNAYLPAFDLVVARDQVTAARLGITYLPFPGSEYPKSIKKAKKPVDPNRDTSLKIYVLYRGEVEQGSMVVARNAEEALAATSADASLKFARLVIKRKKRGEGSAA